MKFRRPNHIRSRAIETFAEEFILISAGEGTRSEDDENFGEFVPGSETESIVTGSMEPVTKGEEALTLVPAGFRMKDLRWIYVSDNIAIKSMNQGDENSEGSAGDFIVYPAVDGEKYKVMNVAKWQDHQRVLIARMAINPVVSNA